MIEWRRTALTLVLALAFASGDARAVDFIRGDTNGDGVITVADAAAVAGMAFWGTETLGCPLAGDFDDNEALSASDVILIVKFAVGSGAPPTAPYPEPGPDPTVSGKPGSLECVTYTGQKPFSDPSAKIRIEDAIADGGDDVHALIRVSVSHSVQIWALSGDVHIGDGLVEDLEIIFKDDALTSPHNPDLVDFGGFSRARTRDGQLSFGFLSEFEPAPELPPGDDLPYLEIKICLTGGVPAGEYPLTLEMGEMTKGRDERHDNDTGQKIVPVLESGTLTVLNDVEPFSTCRVRPLNGVNVDYSLSEATAAVGGTAAVSMSVNADREGHGFGFDIYFDPEVLEALRIEQVFTRPDDLPFQNDSARIDNEVGRLWGFFKSSSQNERHFLPPFQDNRVLVFYFRAKKLVESTELRFDRDSRRNGYKAFDDTFPAEAPNSFFFVDGKVQVVPDISLFIRGDTNGDGFVNISDPQATLAFLFRNGDRPHCLDAADANDDGTLDISDPVRTLKYLFLDSDAALPPPNERDVDPTEDALMCR